MRPGFGELALAVKPYFGFSQRLCYNITIVNMGIEIDFLAVGEAKKSGDAIAVRFGNLHGKREEQTVITIDGGTIDSGERLVEHIKKHYGTSNVDYAFLTHPDGDHASGMREVLEKLTVETVVMHRPWEHSHAIHDLFDDARTSPNSISERSRENLAAAHEVEKLALAKGIKIVEPFAGLATSDQTIRVLGPTKAFYQTQLTRFDFMPEVKESTTDSEIIKTFLAEASRAVNWLADRWDTELLFLEPAEDATSAENNSSLVLLLTVDNKQYLFTGDAGVPALTAALDYATTASIDLTRLCFLQIPHHGSKRNVGPNVLNRLLGSPRTFDKPDRTAFVSAAKEGEPKHPSKQVTNAFRRRGVEVHVTAGLAKCHPMPVREGWGSSTPLPFYSQIEDEESDD